MDGLIERELAAAAGEGIISSEQAERLGTFLNRRLGGPQLSGLRAGDEATNPLEETEMPRFVRGFHDILITIGIIILLAGIAGLSHPAVALIAIIPLAELLVRRQRLALPAFTLTLAFAGSVTWLLVYILTDLFSSEVKEGVGTFFFFLAGYVLTFVPFYWRYRVPVALAAMIALSGGTFILMLAAGTIAVVYGDGATHPVMMLSFCLAGALGLLATALWFDLADPARVTRRSDVAFWLHLVTAPALLYSLLALIFYMRQSGSGWDVGVIATSQPVTVVAVVSVFVLFGLAIDRRAFVTASLVSLGFSLSTLLAQKFSSLGSIFFISLLVLGLIVLTIGVLWPALRRIVIGLLPAGLQVKLPPLR